jgi:hypothetical protein
VALINLLFQILKKHLKKKKEISQLEYLKLDALQEGIIIASSNKPLCNVSGLDIVVLDTIIPSTPLFKAVSAISSNSLSERSGAILTNNAGRGSCNKLRASVT